MDLVLICFDPRWPPRGHTHMSYGTGPAPKARYTLTCKSHRDSRVVQRWKCSALHRAPPVGGVPESWVYVALIFPWTEHVLLVTEWCKKCPRLEEEGLLQRMPNMCGGSWHTIVDAGEILVPCL